MKRMTKVIHKYYKNEYEAIKFFEFWKGIALNSMENFILGTWGREFTTNHLVDP